MKYKAILLLTLLILGGCAHFKKAEQGAPASSESSSVESEKRARELGETRAVFHVIEPLGVHLILTNVESRKEHKVVMDKTLSQLELKEGHWQVSGFILNNTRYRIMNSSKQFIFQIKKKKITYVGSYIFQCPKVNHQHLSEMKKMSFFNRYPFSSKARLCEMVVGSDYDNVNRVWLELGSDNQKPLSLGF